MPPGTYADSQLLNLCLTVVRESSPFVGFQDRTPLGGTVWDSLHEFENVLAGEGWEDPVNFLVSKDMDELKGAKQDMLVSSTPPFPSSGVYCILDKLISHLY